MTERPTGAPHKAGKPGGCAFNIREMESKSHLTERGSEEIRRVTLALGGGRGVRLFPENVSPWSSRGLGVGIHAVAVGRRKTQQNTALPAKIFDFEKSQVDSVLGGGGKQTQILTGRTRS